jgi:hypothetical protein
MDATIWPVLTFQARAEIHMITLEANYSKKIGLPNYSSHQFSVSLKTELADLSQVEQESARLYSVLQQSVDNNIQQIGYALSSGRTLFPLA